VLWCQMLGRSSLATQKSPRSLLSGVVTTHFLNASSKYTTSNVLHA
jgi:hypothetical protein